MHQRAKYLGVTAALAVAACAGQPGQLTVRSIGKPMSADARPVSSRVADGRSQFALGNVALALDSFRRAAREEPGNIDAITGVAACYDRMGRFDVSRKHYEAALAVDPGNAQTLAAFAASLNLQGRTDEAAAVRREIEQRSAEGTGPPLPTAPAQLAHAGVPAPGREPSATNESSGEREALGHVPVPVPPRGSAPIEPIAPPAVVVRLAPPRPAAPAVRMAAPFLPTAPAPSITVTLPPPRPVAAAPARVAAAPRAAQPQPEVASGPRLERISMAEVALVTRRVGPVPANKAGRQQAELSAVRFVPLRQAQAGVPVRVLNAARVDRLAATTRRLMFRRGWTNIVIGNAAAVRARSIVLYPANVRVAAQRLAAQLGFPSAARAGRGEVTILLGSDAAAVVRRRAAI